KPTRAPSGEAKEFVDRGEAAFKAGDYAGAVQSLRHAVVDDPQNALIALMLGQALFATGNFEEAAGATQAAMRQLPKEQWGVIIANYEELYGKRTDYTEQLHTLEKAIKDKPAEPALRFLAGFHYAYLGFATEAVDQLDAGLKLAPRDEMARRLRNEMRAKLANPTKAPAPLLPGLPDESDEPKDE
ncbi:MAG: tetratricopeptide repeat protein, partial [Planctomycetia bacterium]|nr:tetratricopeptide repeat protein [Planctomycetia bacterium]